MNDRSANVGMVLVCLFALPFAGFGLFALSMGVQQLITGEGQGPVIFPLIFGLVFCGVGFGLIFGMIYGRKRVRMQQRLQAEHPGEAWLWRADWAQGHIASKTRTGAIYLWVIALLWNGVTFPVIYFMRDALAQKGSVVYIALLFPLAGLFLLIHAVRQTIAYFEFGKTFFEMSSVPGVVGRELRGTIQARFPHSPNHGIQLRLSCVNRVVTGSGDSQSTNEKILWRDEESLSAAQLYPGPSGTSIPVSFHIPWNAQPTGTRSPRDSTLWLLEARADVPGVDYHDVFEVPVFRTKDTPYGPEAKQAEFTPSHTINRPAEQSVHVQETGSGTEFYFPAARNRGFAASATAFLIVFSAVTYFLSRSKAPMIFAFAFGFFSLLLLYITVQMWLGTARILLGNGTLSVQAGLLGGGSVQRYPFGEVGSITSRITAQQGGGTGTPYYDIEMLLRNGRKVTLGKTLRSKEETAWLVAEMNRLIGSQSRKTAAGQ